jgi:hypothetical protein
MVDKKRRTHKMGITPQDQPKRPQEPSRGPLSFWEVMFGPAEPVGPRPIATPPPVRQAPSQSFLRPTIDVDKYFETKELFDYVRTIRKEPGWRAGMEVAILPLAAATQDPMQTTFEVAQQFKIAEAELARYGDNAWQYVVEPFLRQVEKALNLKKPSDVPGQFKFQFGRDRSFGLSYGE